MPVDVLTRLRPGPPRVVHLEALNGVKVGNDGYHGVSRSLHSRQPSVASASRPSSRDMASSPASVTTAPPSSGSRIGRPPQWTVSRSRKLARLYLYSTLPIEKILKVLEEDGFNPRKNSAQKTIHKMLDNDPRYLRPESRVEMNKRITSLAMSPTRRRKNAAWGRRIVLVRDSRKDEKFIRGTEVTSPSIQSIKAEDTPSFDFPVSPDAPNHSYFNIPFRSQAPEGTTNTHPESSGSSSTGIIQDMKRRVSDCSTHYAFQLCTLIKEFTISISSDDDRSCSRRPSVASSDSSQRGTLGEYEAAPDVYESFPDPAFALPGDFLSAHTRSCADFPGQQHGRGDCWCSIAKETSAQPNSWLLPTGGLSEQASRVMASHSPADLHDAFGNTALHLFAALEGYQEALLGMVVQCRQESLSAVNTAGQTFLHLLHWEWFSDPTSPSTPLRRLLAYIRDTCPELVYETDVYGRTLFHRAHSLIRCPAALPSLVSPFCLTRASRRDAFGTTPVPGANPASQNPYIPPRRIGSPSPVIETFARSNPTSRPLSSDEGSLLAYHTRLVQVIQSSYNNPAIEDAEGRNGLHCLAEAILNQQTMDRHVQATGGRPHLKRKLDSPKDATTPSTPLSTTSTTSTTPVTSSSPSSEAVLSTRLRHLQSLLHPSVAVSATHYDRRGRTPLMAFIEHIPDDHDDKARTLQTLLETLIRTPTPTTTITAPNTSSVVLEARNRRGETPLLLAARLGRKVALATLLECGANVHARDVDGRGVLEVLDGEVGGARAAADVGLYARLEACRVLVTGRREWGVSYANRVGDEGGEAAVVREWRLR